MSDASLSPQTPEVYTGYYGEFTITAADRQEVFLYRLGLAIAAGAFSFGTVLAIALDDQGWTQGLISGLFVAFCGGLGLSLAKIHIYLIPLHRLLQGFWLVGCGAAIVFGLIFPEPLFVTALEKPQTLWGIGFLFAALTGIFFKEGFCFRRLETMLLTPLVPFLLLGHLTQLLPLEVAQIGFSLWSVLFVIFAARKFTQKPADDIGDKSVFDHLKQTQ
ncbi:DUF2301 domain-containing membrane protein [Picosynechococcus sp. PCC 8807]|uniref:DUF2301 domain-containing membrane protein n=1 Tax=Picosynechococcus sp. PCC 8807 TaxID=195248 RepID=UPI000810B2C1|nr:DUF2301 domain-containing membrane protein [Picosynechococcus sp. PCC 8807]ANV90263.1 hypothetical protein AWQ24_06290 [Picosynechococcus sp. PCC 8807]